MNAYEYIKALCHSYPKIAIALLLGATVTAHLLFLPEPKQEIKIVTEYKDKIVYVDRIVEVKANKSKRTNISVKKPNGTVITKVTEEVDKSETNTKEASLNKELLVTSYVSRGGKPVSKYLLGVNYSASITKPLSYENMGITGGIRLADTNMLLTATVKLDYTVGIGLMLEF